MDTKWYSSTNILFGLPMDEERYEKALCVCALQHDLNLMEYGNQTEIGERGINLSGAQKQRIQLARAVYQDCDIYLLDDVFSAVNAHTGTQLFHECILGALSGKTVLLVTHQVDFLYKADLILVMQDGRVMQSGKYAEIWFGGPSPSPQHCHGVHRVIGISLGLHVVLIYFLCVLLGS